MSYADHARTAANADTERVTVRCPSELVERAEADPRFETKSQAIRAALSDFEFETPGADATPDEDLYCPACSTETPHYDHGMVVLCATCEQRHLKVNGSGPA